ncbi:MAG: tyrosine-protein phosphatase [Chloroflexi bacterium]|nr:tyrosine-protein phosphatase [Chloroflexota bacterium]
MVQRSNPREIQFEAILNFRDLGGYSTADGRRIRRGRIFRSGELYYATQQDIARLKGELKLRSVLDLRIKTGITFVGVAPAFESEFRYRNVPLVTALGEDILNNMELLHSLANVGETYLVNVRHPQYGRAVVNALEFIADPANHPLVFYCSAGKDRTGVLAAILLSILGVADDDIIRDYTLTAPYMKRHIDRVSENPEMAKFLQSLPAYMHEAAAESMKVFLSEIRKEYGSLRGFLRFHGADESLFERLEDALLTQSPQR